MRSSTERKEKKQHPDPVQISSSTHRSHVCIKFSIICFHSIIYCPFVAIIMQFYILCDYFINIYFHFSHRECRITFVFIHNYILRT